MLTLGEFRKITAGLSDDVNILTAGAETNVVWAPDKGTLSLDEEFDPEWMEEETAEVLWGGE